LRDGTNNLDRVFNPRTVAVVGAKKLNDYMWLRNVSTFKGPVYSVQIDPAEIPGIDAMGVPNYASLLDIPGPVDYVVVAVPRAVAPRILQDCIRKEVGGATLFTSGFAETGTEEGIKLQAMVTQMAREANFNLIGPNCMGLFVPRLGVRFNADLYHGDSGPVAFISQSGTQAIAFSFEAYGSGIKVSKAVSFGNAVALDSPDYLEYLVNDEETRLIGMYIEGVKDGRRFFHVLREVTAKKPVVVWKGGQTEDSSRATASHTASLAVSSAIWNSMVRQAGAIGVDGMDDMVDVVKTITFAKPSNGDRVGLIATSGGHSVEIADAFSRAGLRVPALSADSYEKLASFFNIIGGSYRNPLEGGGNLASEDNMVTILDILDSDPNVDAIAVEFAAGGMQRNPEFLDRRINTLAQFRQKAQKPLLVVHSPAFPRGDPATIQTVNSKLAEQSIPSYPTFERGARALKKVLDYLRKTS